MKYRSVLLLSGLLLTATVGAAVACSGSDCGDKASKVEKVDASQAVPMGKAMPAADVNAAAPACPACPAVHEEAMKDAGGCPSLMKSASAKAASPESPAAKLTSDNAAPKSSCGMTAGAKCGSKVESNTNSTTELKPNPKAS